MSDFDKEAEREKLREKYGEEQEKRKATEQMSELLLKGATMTNAHCTDCGDPIFRYDGQEFCPTCQKPVARDQGADDGDEGDHIEVADPSDDATVQFGDGADDGADGEPSAADRPSPDAASESPAGPAAESRAEPPEPSPDRPTPEASPDRPTPEASPDRPTPEASPDRPTPEPPETPPTPEPSPDRSAPAAASRDRPEAGESVSAELSAAESVLAETVNRFARRAAEADDPRTAREHLAAAREAAEALDAVRF